MKKLLSLMSIVVFMSSCVSFHSGSLQNSASLSQANFDYVKKELLVLLVQLIFLESGEMQSRKFRMKQEKIC